MRSLRTRLLAAAATTAALAIAAPVASAGAAVPAYGYPGGGYGYPAGAGPGGCVGSNAPSGVGDSGATDNQVCGSVLAFVGPDVGQVATVVAPTIIGSVVNAPIIVSAGPAGAGANGPPY